MPNVVTPFSRKHHATAQQSTTTHPRHRREGWFDEQDQWHDSSETQDSTASGS